MQTQQHLLTGVAPRVSCSAVQHSYDLFVLIGFISLKRLELVDHSTIPLGNFDNASRYVTTRLQTIVNKLQATAMS